MEIALGIDFVGIGILIAIIWATYKIIFELQVLSSVVSNFLKEIKEELKNMEASDARVTRRDINDDYGFRNPLLRSEAGYRVNRRGQYVPNKPNVEEDEDV